MSKASLSQISPGNSDGGAEFIWDALPVVLWVVSPNGFVRRVNRASEDLLGYEAREFEGIALDEILVESAQFESLAQSLEELGKVTDWEVCVRCKDGSTRNILIDANRDSEAGDAIYCVVRDHSVTKRTEEHVREQVEFVEKIDEAVVIQGLDGRVLHWDAGAEALYGISALKVIGKEIPEEFCHNKTQIAAARQAVLAKGEWSGELLQTTASGTNIKVQSRWLLVRDSSGNPQSIVTINIDADQAINRDEELLRMQRQECIGTLAGGIAHDLNNVLQPISMALEMFYSRLTDDEGQEMVEMVESNLRRATELVRQILTFTAGVRGERSSVEIEPLFLGVGNFVRQSFPKGIELKSTIAQNLDAVLGDSTQIEQILLNLCVNARDAMPGGGSIKLDACNFDVDEGFASRQSQARPGRYVRLSVSDTGSGIPRSLRKKIFEPFFTTKGPDKGTGLGLATVLGIVRSHDGFLTLETEEGEGTTFQVFLPSLHVEDTEVVKPRKNALAGELEGAGEAILLVDDEPTVLKVMQRALEKSGYAVLAATDGEHGAALYAEHHQNVRLVITDMSMPGMDGPELIANLRKINPDVKIICTSGMNTESNTNIFKELGIATVLPKPCNSRTILEAIKTTLGADAAEAA